MAQEVSSYTRLPPSQKCKQKSNEQIALLHLCPAPVQAEDYRFGPDFYDQLSRVHLTKAALDELRSRTLRSHWPQAPQGSSEPTSNECKTLHRFTRHTGLYLSELRGYADMPPKSRFPGEPQDNPGGAVSRRTTRPGRESTPYDRNFKQHCTDHGIHVDDRGQQAINQQSIEKEIAAKLLTCEHSPSLQAEFAAIQEAIREAVSEEDIFSGVLNPIIDGSGMKLQRNAPFNKLAPLTNGDTKAYKPDAYDGCRPEDIDPRVLEDLGDYIVPSANKSARCLPNIIIEVKGPSGNQSTGILQVTWGGALAVRGMDKLLEWASLAAPSEPKASVFSILISGDQYPMLSIFMHYSVRIATDLQYLAQRLTAFDLVKNEETYLRAKQTVKIVVEIAQRLRNEAVTLANAKAKSCDGHF